MEEETRPPPHIFPLLLRPNTRESSAPATDRHRPPPTATDATDPPAANTHSDGAARTAQHVVASHQHLPSRPADVPSARTSSQSPS